MLYVLMFATTRHPSWDKNSLQNQYLPILNECTYILDYIQYIKNLKHSPQVQIIPFFREQYTQDAFLKELDRLNNILTSKDIVMCFMEAHGNVGLSTSYINSDLEDFIVYGDKFTWDKDIFYSDDYMPKLIGLNAGKILFFTNSCHSGSWINGMEDKNSNGFYFQPSAVDSESSYGMIHLISITNPIMISNNGIQNKLKLPCDAKSFMEYFPKVISALFTKINDDFSIMSDWDYEFDQEEFIGNPDNENSFVFDYLELQYGLLNGQYSESQELYKQKAKYLVSKMRNYMASIQISGVPQEKVLSIFDFLSGEIHMPSYLFFSNSGLNILTLDASLKNVVFKELVDPQMFTINFKNQLGRYTSEQINCVKIIDFLAFSILDGGGYQNEIDSDFLDSGYEVHEGDKITVLIHRNNPSSCTCPALEEYSFINDFGKIDYDFDKILTTDDLQNAVLSENVYKLKTNEKEGFDPISGQTTTIPPQIKRFTIPEMQEMCQDTSHYREVTFINHKNKCEKKPQNDMTGILMATLLHQCELSYGLYFEGVKRLWEWQGIVDNDQNDSIHQTPDGNLACGGLDSTNRYPGYYLVQTGHDGTWDEDELNSLFLT